MEEEIEESFDDSKSQKTQKDKKKMGNRTSLDQHKLSGNSRGGFKKSARGRKRKVGSTRVTSVTKERGRRSLFKKQVIYLGVF